VSAIYIPLEVVRILPRQAFKSPFKATELKFVQTGVPEGSAEDVARGWKDYYWGPMAEYFSKQPGKKRREVALCSLADCAFGRILFYSQDASIPRLILGKNGQEASLHSRPI